MSWRSAFVCVAAAVVLFAFVWLVERPERHRRARAESRLVLPGLEAAAVTSVGIKPSGAPEIRAARNEGSTNSWKLVRPLECKAQAAPIEAFLAALTNLTWAEHLTPTDLRDVPDAQEKYGFAKSRVAIELGLGGDTCKLLLGELSVGRDQIFLERVGSAEIYLVNVDFLQLAPFSADQWRDPALLDLGGPRPLSIQARSPDKGFDLVLDPDTGLWSMTNPVTARADTARVNEMLEQLQLAQVLRFVSDDPKLDLEPLGLLASAQTPLLDLTIRRGAAPAAAVQLGGSLSNYPGISFARRPSPPCVVLVSNAPLLPWLASYTNLLDYHMISGPPSAVGGITVQDGTGGHFEVVRQSGGQWQVWAETTFPADAELVRDWLAAFTNIPTQIEKTVATDLAAYGLDHPQLQYTLRPDTAGRPELAVIQFGSNNAGRVLERRTDEKSVNSLDAGDFNRLPRSAWQLRDRHIWSFDTTNVISLTIHQQGAERKFLRDPSGDWTFAPGFHGPPEVNWPAVEEGVHRLGGLTAVYWSGSGTNDDDTFGFPAADFSLALELRRGGTNETLSIAFGGRSPYSYPYAAVVKDGRREIFEFPADLYENFVDRHMSIPAALRFHH